MTPRLLFAAALLAAAPAFAQALLQRAEVESLLTREIQQTVDAQKRLPGQGGHVKVQATLDARGTVLTINLSTEFLPADYGADLEDALHELSTRAYDLLRDRSRVETVRFTFGGRELHDYFPAEREPLKVRPRAQKPEAGGLVVVGAGHGIYFHHGFNDWRAQRDPSNGITEDFITPGLASELQNWLAARSEALVVQARSGSSAVHVPSNAPWWQMAARYNLQELYPDEPEIWHSRPNDTSNLRERNEDINSRPLLANHLGAGTVLHIHTNAAGAGATGTRAFFHTGRTTDQKLGDNILCYMKELIHAREGYEGWTVPRSANAASDNGENRRAAMPSVIVEVGFHTNPSDAAALQDPIFRTAAMKGVEKGYRLHGEGKPCEPFKLQKIKDVSGGYNVPIPVSVPFKGFPQFPVKATVEIISCPPGYVCTGGELTYEDKQDSPLSYSFTCFDDNPAGPSTTVLETRLEDVDEVKTKPVQHSVTCLAGGGFKAGKAGKAGGQRRIGIGR